MKVKVSISNKCNLCGLCVEACPTEVFKIVEKNIVVNEDSCIYCRGCEIICPEKAISLKLMTLSEIATLHKPLL